MEKREKKALEKKLLEMEEELRVREKLAPRVGAVVFGGWGLPCQF